MDARTIRACCAGLRARVGGARDIKSGKDWEGSGIAPDVAVEPKLALVKALEMAGVGHAEAVRIDALEVPAEPVHKGEVGGR